MRNRKPIRIPPASPSLVPVAPGELDAHFAAQVERTRIEITDHGMAVFPPGWTLGPRHLRDYELLWILEGDVEWEVDGSVHRLGPGSVALMQPETRDFWRWDRDGWTRHAFFHFTLHGDGFGDPRRWPTVRRMPEGDVIRPLFQLLLQTTAARPHGWRRVQEDAARLLLWTFVSGRENVGIVGRTTLHPVIEGFVAHLRKRWMRLPLTTPTLAELAAVANISKQHLCRVFAAEVGASPVETVRTLRLYWAAMRLSNTQASISFLGQQAGFADPYHFSRRFRALYGCPPRVFRERARAGLTSFASIPPPTAAVASRVWRLRE